MARRLKEGVAEREEKSCGGRFYGTGIEIWAGFGPVWQLLRPVFFMFSWAKKIF